MWKIMEYTDINESLAGFKFEEWTKKPIRRKLQLSHWSNTTIVISLSANYAYTYIHVAVATDYEY